MKTVDQVITRFRRHYPGCDATTALDLFQTRYKRLLDKAGFRTADVTFSAIVAGIREYDWAEADIRVYGVTWYTSATSWAALRPMSEDELRDRDDAWKESTDRGTPTEFYIAPAVDGTANHTGKLVIGFNLIPDTSTSGGYPKAVCHTEQHAAISGATIIPYSVLDEMYFVYGMCEDWAYESDVKKAPIWERKRISEEAVQIEHLRGLSANDAPTQLLPPLSMFSTRIT